MRRFKHNLSHTHLTTGDFGELIPAQWTEILPGDSIRASTSCFTRATPLLAPVMHPVSIRLHHFFVPIRLLNDEFEDFITGADATAAQLTAAAIGDELDDWLGIPPLFAGTVLQYPRLAYELIYKEYYRDQETQPFTPLNVKRSINYEKDYVTLARTDPSNNPNGQKALVKNDGVDDYIDPLDMRKALARQKFDEARSRYGARYTEYLQYLGIKPSDARLQRPEFLGGGSGNLNFSEVLATAETTGQPTGSLLGHGIAGVRSRPFTRFFEEHGIFMTMLSVRPKAMYADQLAREWKRFSKESYWQKETQFEGQQPIFNYEVYANAVDAENNIVFGYNDRHYDYRRGISRISGEFRTTYDYWHLARQFSSRPGLNSQFALVDDPANRRIFADQVNDGFLFNISNKIVARRLVTNNPTPRTV